MEHKESGRHLAAILFTDIVGYTAMMQQDEALAMAAVRRHQEVLEKLVQAYEGEVFQYYGDGSLNIFHSAIQAVKAAMAIQLELQKHPQIPLRIGIHIGEIYSEEGKIFGDGVNIASRIESIGQAGTVLFSRDVYEKIRNHGPFQTQSIGRYEFKNVVDPIEVYALTNPGINTPDPNHIEGKLKENSRKKTWKPSYLVAGLVALCAAVYFLFINPQLIRNHTPGYPVRQSIAVLPFQNFSEGKEEDFLRYGIAEDILTQLAQIPNLKVISRASSMQYNDSSKPIKSIAKDLNVTNILEGSVRKYDNMLRVTVKLTDGKDENLIWAEDFTRKFEDILNIQQEIALAVSRNLKVALTPQVENRFQKKVVVNPEAYINYQKGQDVMLRSNGTTEDVETAIGFFEKSIALDSNFARAWVGLADAYSEGVFWHRMNAEYALLTAKNAASKALEIDPELGEAYGALGSVAYNERHFIEAEKNLSKAIEFSPNYSFAYERLAWIKILRKDVSEAKRLFEQAIDLDPYATRYQGSIGNSFGIIGRYEEGIRITKQYLLKNPTDNYLLWTLGFLYARTGEYAKCIEVLNRRSIGTKTNWVLGYAYAKSGQREKAEEILNNNLEKQKTQHVPDFMIAVQYCGLGDDQKALEYLQRGIHSLGESFFIMALENDPFFENLYKYPEFQRAIEETRKDFTL